MHLIKSKTRGAEGGGRYEEKLFFFLYMPLNKRHHHRIQKIKIAQTMNITKHNNKNGTTMRRSKKLFLHRCCNSVVSMNGFKKKLL